MEEEPPRNEPMRIVPTPASEFGKHVKHKPERLTGEIQLRLDRDELLGFGETKCNDPLVSVSVALATLARPTFDQA